MARLPIGITLSAPYRVGDKAIVDIHVSQRYVRSYRTYLWAFA